MPPKGFRKSACVNGHNNPKRHKNGECAECKSTRNRERNVGGKNPRKDNTPERNREQKLMRAYGMTTEDWDKLFLSQDSRCAICKSTDPRNKNGWAVDHNHVSGLPRGILCHYCNMIVAFVEKGLGIIVPAVEEYLKMWYQLHSDVEGA